MKISFTIAIISLAIVSRGQQISNFTVTLNGWSDSGRQVPSVLDTVFLNSSYSKTTKTYTGISISDTSFQIPDIPVGKHWLLFSTKSFCVFPFPIIVCSKCANHFSFYASPKKEGYNCDIFEMVEVSPSYIGGNKAMAKDFIRNLNKIEKKKLKTSSDFIVHFYLTKQGTISDPSFILSDLSQEIKNIIVKGLSAVTNWRSAERNGLPVDAEFKLRKRDLLNY